MGGTLVPLADPIGKGGRTKAKGWWAAKSNKSNTFWRHPPVFWAMISEFNHQMDRNSSPNRIGLIIADREGMGGVLAISSAHGLK
jgi:hypothetical protein